MHDVLQHLEDRLDSSMDYVSNNYSVVASTDAGLLLHVREWEQPRSQGRVATDSGEAVRACPSDIPG